MMPPFHERPQKFFFLDQKEYALFYGNSHKKSTSLPAIARYMAISYKIDYLQFFQAGYFFTKKKIAMVFNETTIMTLFYLARLASITCK